MEINSFHRSIRKQGACSNEKQFSIKQLCVKIPAVARNSYLYLDIIRLRCCGAAIIIYENFSELSQIAIFPIDEF